MRLPESATPEQAHDVLVAFVLWWQHRHPCQHPTTIDATEFLTQWTPPVTPALAHRCVTAAYNDRVELADGTAVYLQRDEFGGSLEVGGGAGGVARPAYDPHFGDERECVCGHSYRRHFDTYADMKPVGCKYCGCATWQAPAELPPLPTQCSVCGEQYVGDILEAAAEHHCPLAEDEADDDAPPVPPVRCVPCPGACDAPAQAACYEAQTGTPARFWRVVHAKGGWWDAYAVDARGVAELGPSLSPINGRPSCDLARQDGVASGLPEWQPPGEDHE